MRIVVFLVCSVLGFLAGHLFPTGAWATFVSILVSYHLFLIWLVITAEQEAGFSLPIGSTIVTHLACLTLVVTFGMGRNIIPFFGLIRYFIPAIAPFERDWIFKGNTKKAEGKEKKVSVKPAKAAAAIPLVSVDFALSEATLEDHDEWIRHLSQHNRPLKRAGLSVKEEYEQWLVARVSARQAAASFSPQPPPDSPESQS